MWNNILIRNLTEINNIAPYVTKVVIFRKQNIIDSFYNMHLRVIPFWLDLRSSMVHKLDFNKLVVTFSRHNTVNQQIGFTNYSLCTFGFVKAPLLVVKNKHFAYIVVVESTSFVKA